MKCSWMLQIKNYRVSPDLPIVDLVRTSRNVKQKQTKIIQAIGDVNDIFHDLHAG